MIKIISNNKSYIKYKLPITNFYLIQWKPKSKTDIHNHNGKNCQFVLFNSSLQEVRYKNKKISSLYESNKIKPFKIQLINDNQGYHQVFNFDDKIKWSLHHYY
jgi:hypothetical protein